MRKDISWKLWFFCEYSTGLIDFSGDDCIEERSHWAGPWRLHGCYHRSTGQEEGESNVLCLKTLLGLHGIWDLETDSSISIIDITFHFWWKSFEVK